MPAPIARRGTTCFYWVPITADTSGFERALETATERTSKLMPTNPATLREQAHALLAEADRVEKDLTRKGDLVDALTKMEDGTVLIWEKYFIGTSRKYTYSAVKAQGRWSTSGLSTQTRASSGLLTFIDDNADLDRLDPYQTLKVIRPRQLDQLLSINTQLLGVATVAGEREIPGNGMFRAFEPTGEVTWTITAQHRR